MTMKPILMTVHSAGPASFSTPTKVEGDDVMSSVPCWEVEMTTDVARHGTLTMRYIGADLQWAKENLVPGAKIILSGTVTPPPVAEQSKAA